MRDSQKKLMDFLVSSQGDGLLSSQLEDVEMIAEGGMAYIYRARQSTLDRHIVIKQLKEKDPPELVDRFRREAKTLASVLHQNVAHVYELIERDNHHYILMEYISGVDLSTVLKKMGPIPPVVAASILLGVARGLSAIHNHRLIHRDIKPSNIRITDRGEVKLMDLGIVLDSNDNALTRPGVLVGSRFYLSPEQVLGDPVGPTSDIFLLGICLYEMLSGVRPFQDHGTESVFQRIRHAKYTPIRKMQPKVPKRLENIIKKALQQDPRKRYRTAEHVVRDLEAFLGPVRSSNSADIILHFADQEALLKPTIPLLENPSGIQRKTIFWKNWAIGLVAALVTFAAGYVVAKNMSGPPKIPANYSAPKNIRR